MIISNKSCSDLRASIAGKDLPEDIKQRLLSMHEENLNLKESHRTLLDKLTKAKQVIDLWFVFIYSY
jgi:protein HOOK3